MFQLDLTLLLFTKSSLPFQLSLQSSLRPFLLFVIQIALSSMHLPSCGLMPLTSIRRHGISCFRGHSISSLGHNCPCSGQSFNANTLTQLMMRSFYHRKHNPTLTGRMSLVYNWITTLPVMVGLSLKNTAISSLLFISFIESTWVPRGVLVISAKDVISTPSFVLSDSQVSQLKEAAKDPLKLVRIRAKVDKVDASQATYTFIRACALYESSLSDLISVYFDSSGLFMGTSVTSTNPSCISTIDAPAKTFNTTVEVVTTAIGPVPDTQTYLQRLEQEKQEKLRGDKQDNRSFLAKYVSINHLTTCFLSSWSSTFWHVTVVEEFNFLSTLTFFLFCLDTQWIYIVPLVIFMLISGASNPEGEGS